MTTFLLLVSFILNITAILLVIILYLRQNRLIAVEKRQEKMFREMEELISSYLFEMKEENELFIQRVQQAGTKGNSAPSANAKGGSPDQETAADSRETGPSTSIGKGSRQQAVKAYKKSSENPPVEIEGETLLPQVLSLAKQGFNVDEIAKKMNKGKTEIELFLKFNQNEQE